MARQKFRFTQNYDHRIDVNTEVAYKAGQEVIIPQDHADAAKALGVGDFVGAAEEDQPAANSKTAAKK